MMPEILEYSENIVKVTWSNTGTVVVGRYDKDLVPWAFGNHWHKSGI